MSQPAEYDAIAEAYQDSKRLPFREYVERYPASEFALGNRSCQAEAEADVAVSGRIRVAIHRATRVGSTAPPTAAPNPATARGRALGVRDRIGGIVPIPVRHPLPDVAVHIIQPPLVGLITPDRSGPAGDTVRTGRVPPRQVRAAIGVVRILAEFGLRIAKVVPRLRSGPGRVLPFRFGW